MSFKHFRDLKWKSVPLENLNATNSDFEGLVAIEECCEYDVDVLRDKNKQQQNDRKGRKKKRSIVRSANDIVTVPAKKINKPKKETTIQNGFIVECVKHQSSDPDIDTNSKSSKKKKDSKKKRMKKKLDGKVMITPTVKSKPAAKSAMKKQRSLGESVARVTDAANKDSSLEDMSAWCNMGIPENILKALAEQGFTQPMEIQRLTLPPAILGRRDILGAAETGSGKTLAFGIPIVNGIMQIKKKVESGEDFNETVFKKNTSKVTTKKSAIEDFSVENEEVKLIRKFKKTGREKRNADDIDDDDIDPDIDDDDVGVDVDDDDIENDDSEPEDDDAPSDDEQSDLSEEEVEALDENGIGCVKVIDNIEMKTAKKTSTLKPLYALILTPTRELAVQIRNHLVALTKYTDIRVAVVLGGMAHVKQERILSKCPEIVVATPGRLWELIQQGNDHLSQIDNIRFLAIDETDRMLEKGHFEELQSLLERINLDDKKRLARQNFVFSATLTLVHDLPDHAWRKKVTKRGKVVGRKMEKMTSEKKLKRLVEMLGITNPKIVDVTISNQGKASTLIESRISCPIDYKDFYLYYILKRHPGRTIVFCNSIGCVKRLSQLFSILKCNPLPLHASMIQRQRLKNLERFRDNPYGVLISTDVAARGLDIPNIDHVIHYQVPRTAENYVHRSGRTARASKEGITILMMEPGEAINYAKLCKTLGKKADIPTFPVPDALLLATKERVKLARDLDKLELRTKKTNAETGWLQKAIKEMDIIVDDDEMPFKMQEETPKNMLVETRKRLTALLNKPLFPKGFSFKYPSTNAPTDIHSFDSDIGKENALDVMKSALETGIVKKLKKTSKNEGFLKMSAKKKAVGKIGGKKKQGSQK